MTEFVKICPRCKQANPEYENVCTSCQQFIGMEPAVPRPAVAEAVEKNQPSADTMSAQKINSASQTKEKFAGDDVSGAPEVSETIYAQILNSNEILSLHPGSIIGQSHPTSQATALIPTHLPGAAYVHRQHCRIDFENGEWYVFAIDQSAFQQTFNNPTRVNQKLITPGSRQAIQNNDELRLSGVSLRLRIM